MKWKKQLCAAAAVLLALGIALAGVLLNQHFLVLSGGISRTEIQSPLGDWVRSHLQLVALIVFATLAAAILALYHYKKQPELRYFLLYLAVLFFWGTLVAFFPAGFQGLLQRFMRLFFAITILASALLSAALLALPLPAKWVVPASAVFLLLGQVRLPILRFGTLTAGMCLCLYLLLSAYLRGYEAAGLLLFPCAITTGFRVWALLPTLPFYVECYPLYLLRCARVFDIPFALGCMTYVCRRFALQFDRTEQLAQELDTRVIERTRALTEETEARKSMMLNIFHDLRSPLFVIGSGLGGLECGVMLSREGMGVCIVEQAAVPGGCLQSFRRRGHSIDTGMHYVGSMQQGGIMRRYFDYFGIGDSLEIRPLDEAFDIVSPGGAGEFAYMHGYDEFRRHLTSLFPREAAGIARYCDKIREIGDSIGVEGLPRLLFEYAAEIGRVHMDMLRCRRQRQRLGKVLCDKAADLVDGRVGGRAQIPDVGE